MRSATIRSEINVTPLVDVCLVLLIIFVVVTPMLMNDWVPRESLLSALRDIHDQSLDPHVVVKADRRLEYRSVREVMQLVNRGGFTGAGIETRKHEAGR